MLKTSQSDFSAAQKEYLDGFFRAMDPNRREAGPLAPPAPYAGRERLGYDAQLKWLADGKRLSKEESIKHAGNPLDAWDDIAQHSAEDKLPQGEDVFRFKFHGLWNVSPAQEGMMCRLRIPGGALSAEQMRAVAGCAESFGGGYADITTRANMQIREIPARHLRELLETLHGCGIMPRGSGADNIRNVTGSATAGFDAVELIDVLPLCRQLHHHLLHHREYYGLPRKFNIAFEGGGAVATLQETNDIGFTAVSVGKGETMPPGVYFRAAVGGITGHQDFARDTGLLLTPGECLPLALAMVRVFIAHGDRGNRKKARLKYVLDAMGLEKFMAETEKELGSPLRRFPAEHCVFAPESRKDAHMGVHLQKQEGRVYLGVDVPVGRLSAEQMRGLAGIAENFGRSELRLTVWQNILIPFVDEKRVPAALAALADLGLSVEPDPISAGLVACTGSEGCKFGQAPTKGTAKRILERLKGTLPPDTAVNIHLTGCPHSCAQHFIGDIGLLATTAEIEAATVPAFHVLVGGGFGRDGRMAVPVFSAVPAEDIVALIERMLRIYLDLRRPGETFGGFCGRHTSGLVEIFSARAQEPVHA